MKIPIAPGSPLLAQLRPWGLHLRGSVMNGGVLVYRFYGTDEALLYVGVTCSPPVRFQSHKNYAPWWSEVAFLMVERHPYKTAAHAAETEAINTEHPKYNVQRKGVGFKERVGSESGASRESPTCSPLTGPNVVGDHPLSRARAGARATRRVRDRRQETGFQIHPSASVTAGATTRRTWMAAARQIVGGSCQ